MLDSEGAKRLKRLKKSEVPNPFSRCKEKHRMEKILRKKRKSKMEDRDLKPERSEGSE
ncbi:MAG: hypothetical protein AB1297_08440 [bacterium]